MTSPAEGFKAILANLGVIDGATGWSGYIGDLPDTPHQAVTIYDTGGRGGEVKVAIDYPTVQVVVRGSPASGGYAAGYAKAQAIYDAMVGIDTPHASWDKLVSCVQMGFINWLGRDDTDRPRFSVNFRLITLPDNEGNRNY